MQHNIVKHLRLLGFLLIGLPLVSWAHGSMTPQAVNTEGLRALGEEWFEENPYRCAKDTTCDPKLTDVSADKAVTVGDFMYNSKALEIGKSAYNQNCARCHGLGAVSGGIAPDLRNGLQPDFDSDEWYVYRVREGAIRNGITYMPKMAEHISQEALWSIRAWMETLCKDDDESREDCAKPE